MRYQRLWPAALAVTFLIFSGVALAQDMHPEARNVSGMTLSNLPGLPTCATGAVQSGDPAKGPSIIYTKAAAGCIVPWHWHTPTEHLMIVSGTARIETKDGKPSTLRQGAFVTMPSHHVHQFTCVTTCAMYVSADGAFDIHYVDKSGTEVAPEDALKAVKEKSAKPAM